MSKIWTVQFKSTVILKDPCIISVNQIGPNSARTVQKLTQNDKLMQRMQICPKCEENNRQYSSYYYFLDKIGLVLLILDNHKTKKN